MLQQFLVMFVVPMVFLVVMALFVVPAPASDSPYAQDGDTLINDLNWRIYSWWKSYQAYGEKMKASTLTRHDGSQSFVTQRFYEHPTVELPALPADTEVLWNAAKAAVLELHAPDPLPAIRPVRVPAFLQAA